MDEGRVAGALKQQRWACSLMGGAGVARLAIPEQLCGPLREGGVRGQGGEVPWVWWRKAEAKGARRPQRAVQETATGGAA